jgi:hypothetical protein
MACTCRLNRVTYSESKIPRKVTRSKTKTEAIVNKALDPHSVATAIQDLNEIPYLAVCTDGSNGGSLKLFPVLIQYFHDVHGLQSKLKELNSTTNEKSGTTVNYITQTLEDHAWPLYKVRYSLVKTST